MPPGREADDPMVVLVALQRVDGIDGVGVEDDLAAVVDAHHRREPADVSRADRGAGRRDARHRSGARPRSDDAAFAFVLPVVEDVARECRAEGRQSGLVHGHELGPARDLASVGERSALLHDHGLRAARGSRDDLHGLAADELARIKADRSPRDRVVDDGRADTRRGPDRLRGAACAGDGHDEIESSEAVRLAEGLAGRTAAPAANAVPADHGVVASMSGSQVAFGPRKLRV